MAFNLVFLNYSNFLASNLKRLESESLASSEIKELHALNSYIKCRTSYYSMEVILNMREVCGGHGYSAYGGFGMLSDQNVQITWEGTNDVLIQQTAKFLLQVIQKFVQKGKLMTQSFYFLEQLNNESLVEKEVSHMKQFFSSLDPKNVDLKMLLFCLQRLEEMSIKKQVDLITEQFITKSQEIEDQFELFNFLYPQGLRELCFMFGDYQAGINFSNFVRNIDANKFPAEMAYLAKILAVQQIWMVSGNFSLLGESFPLAVKTKLEAIAFELYPHLIDDSVILLDAFLPPDLLLNSNIGKRNGEVYQNILN